tara:strand:- start:42 stop:704 length:663 start_codon:yes stop_codon:yes gene_type:complete
MFDNMSGRNIKYRRKKRLYNTDQESILMKDDAFDCVNIKGPVDNSSCTDTDSLCNCPCTGAAAPLFQEPSNQEIEWAESVANEGDLIRETLRDVYLGCITSDPDSLMSTDCPCHGKDFYSYLRASKTYSTFWETNQKVPIIRNALLNLYAAQTANCIIPGNLEVSIGDFLVLPDDGTALGAKYSGSWLISRIEHRIASLQNYKMVLTLIRDNRIPDPEGG